MARYRPDPKILTLGDDFYDPVAAARFPKCVPRFVNERWAERVGLDLEEEDWARHFCRFEPLPGNLIEPLALRYHGHQFRAYNPEIGDGRGFTFAQLREPDGKLLDLGTKGSGQTPYSRHADGRLTLKGGVRELLATEMLEALGVNTSKSFALFETGENLERGDEPSPTRSSVLTRLSHGHIRIGTFQRLAFLGEAENISKLVRYCLENLYSE
jgi:serine/tyrosine/threonine adenylyltransferase